MSIRLDYREHALESELNKLNIEYTKENLLLGDCIIGDNLIVERKTVDDLWHSICDGRYREQTSRLRDCKGKVAILIEGTVKKPALWGCMASWTLRDNFFVWRTKNVKETAIWIRALSKKHASLKDTTTENTTENTEKLQLIRKKVADNQTSVFLIQLSVIPGISIKKARAIMEKYPSFHSLLEANVEDLISIKCGKRKLGKVLANRIYNLMISNDSITSDNSEISNNSSDSENTNN